MTASRLALSGGARRPTGLIAQEEAHALYSALRAYGGLHLAQGQVNHAVGLLQQVSLFGEEVGLVARPDT